MKRSEIVEHMLGSFRGAENLGNMEAMMSYVLRGLEDVGMQPPQIKATFQLTKADGSKQNSFSMVNRWEPEND